jgi:hypothetical protein
LRAALSFDFLFSGCYHFIVVHKVTSTSAAPPDGLRLSFNRQTEQSGMIGDCTFVNSAKCRAAAVVRRADRSAAIGEGFST